MAEAIKRKALGAQRSKSSMWWHTPMHIAVHIFVGAAIFGVIALAAVGLALLTAWAKALTYGGQPFVGELVVGGLMVGEYALFAIDIILFLVFLAKTGWRMFKEL